MRKMNIFTALTIKPIVMLIVNYVTIYIYNCDNNHNALCHIFMCLRENNHAKIEAAEI